MVCTDCGRSRRRRRSWRKILMRLPVLALAGSVALLLLSCNGTRRVANVYCDASTPCSDVNYPLCDEQHHTCVAADMGCPVNCQKVDMGPTADMGPVCIADCSDMAMPQCTSSASCADNVPICGSDQVCRACSNAGDDAACAQHNAATPYCDGSSGACVACTPGNNMQSTQCAAATPVCDSAATCRKCSSSSECASLGSWPEGDATGGFCNSDGTCVTVDQVAFVDNRGNPTACATAHPTPTGTTADPYCDIAAGVSSAKAVVFVKGQTPSATSAYSHVAVGSSRSVIIIGPGPGATKPAEIYDMSGNDLVLLSAGAGTDIAVTLDGLVIGDSINNTLQNIANCTTAGSGKANLTIRRSTLQHTAGTNKYGLAASGCDVTVDQSLIESNQAGGVLLANSDFTIQNTVVANNGNTASAFGGIQVSGSGAAGRALIVNVTDADNTAAMGNFSALDCPGANAIVIFNTAVANNLHTTEIRPSCVLSSSAYAGGTGTNHDITGCSDTQLFQNSGPNPYAPLAGAAMPCVLVGAGSSSFMTIAAPSYDLAGTSRPNPPAVGAYE